MEGALELQPQARQPPLLRLSRDAIDAPEHLHPRRALSLKAGRRPRHARWRAGWHAWTSETVKGRRSGATTGGARSSVCHARGRRRDAGCLGHACGCATTARRCATRRVGGAGQRGRDFGTPSPSNRSSASPSGCADQLAPRRPRGEFCAAWLRELGGSGDGGAVDAADAADAADAEALASSTALPEFEYSELRAGGDAAAHGLWLSALAAHGATLLRGVPCEEHRVAEVAELIGPLSRRSTAIPSTCAPSRGRSTSRTPARRSARTWTSATTSRRPASSCSTACASTTPSPAARAVLIDGFAVGERLRRDDPAPSRRWRACPPREGPRAAREPGAHVGGPTSPSTAAAASSASSGRARWRGRSASRPPTSALLLRHAYRALDAAIAGAPAVRRRLRPGLPLQRG